MGTARVTPLDAQLLADLEAIRQEEHEALVHALASGGQNSLALLLVLEDHQAGDAIVAGDSPGRTPVVEQVGGDDDLVADIEVNDFAVRVGRVGLAEGCGFGHVVLL